MRNLSPCCESRYDKIMQARFPSGPSAADLNLTIMLDELNKDFGGIAYQVGDPVLLTAVLQLGFASAEVVPVKCDEGHRYSMVFVAGRLFLFIYRLGAIMSSLFEEDAGDLIVRPIGPQAIADVAKAAQAYFSEADIADGLGVGIDLFANAVDAAGVHMMEAVTAAEVFVLLHELQHLRPPGVRRNVNIPDPSPGFWLSPRGGAWKEEINCDAEALMLLIIEGAKRLAARPEFSNEQARIAAAMTACMGSDLALGTIELLETISTGPISLAEAVGHPSFHTHPPAQQRRNWSSWVAKTYVTDLCNLSPQSINAVMQSAGTFVTLRQNLFDAFLATRGDVVAEIRNSLL